MVHATTSHSACSLSWTSIVESESMQEQAILAGGVVPANDRRPVNWVMIHRVVVGACHDSKDHNLNLDVSYQEGRRYSHWLLLRSKNTANPLFCDRTYMIIKMIALSLALTV